MTDEEEIIFTDCYNRLIVTEKKLRECQKGPNLAREEELQRDLDAANMGILAGWDREDELQEALDKSIARELESEDHLDEALINASLWEKSHDEVVKYRDKCRDEANRLAGELRKTGDEAAYLVKELNATKEQHKFILGEEEKANTGLRSALSHERGLVSSLRGNLADTNAQGAKAKLDLKKEKNKHFGASARYCFVLAVFGIDYLAQGNWAAGQVSFWLMLVASFCFTLVALTSGYEWWTLRKEIER